MLLHHQAIEGLRRALHSRSASSRHRRYPSCLTIQAHLSGITFEELSHCLNPQQDTGLSNHPTVTLLQRDTSCLVYQDPSHIHDCYQNHIADSFNVYLRLLCTPFVSTKLRSALYRVQPRQPIPTSPGQVFRSVSHRQYVSYAYPRAISSQAGRFTLLTDINSVHVNHSSLTCKVSLRNGCSPPFLSPVWKCSSIRTRAFA